jgi:hypothetical protein
VAVFAPKALTYTGLFHRRLLMHDLSGARRTEQRFAFIAKNQRDGLPRGLTFEVSGTQRRGPGGRWARLKHAAQAPRRCGSA